MQGGSGLRLTASGGISINHLSGGRMKISFAAVVAVFVGVAAFVGASPLAARGQESIVTFTTDGTDILAEETRCVIDEPVSGVARVGDHILISTLEIRENYDKSPSNIFLNADGLRESCGQKVYTGPLRVLNMTAYGDGLLTAVSNVYGNPGLYGVFWSEDLTDPLGQSAEARYIGPVPVTAMIEYEGGVITAFAPGDADDQFGTPPEEHFVAYWSSDGKDLYREFAPTPEDDLRYRWRNRILDLTVDAGGNLLTTLHTANEIAKYKVVGSAGDVTGRMVLGAGKIYYEGNVPPVAAAWCDTCGATLTGFENESKTSIPSNAIYAAKPGDQLQAGQPGYSDKWPVVDLASYQDGVLSAFSNVDGVVAQHWQAIHFNVVASGNWLFKLTKELDTAEAFALINGICVYFTTIPCPDIAGYITAAAQLLNNELANGGPNEYVGALTLSDGLICNAYVNFGSFSMTGHATFNASLSRDRRSLNYYAFVRGGDRRDWVDFMVYLDVIPDNTSTSGCMEPTLADRVLWYCGEKTPAGPKNCIGSANKNPVVGFIDAWHGH
jgi:hypothetical protein